MFTAFDALSPFDDETWSDPDGYTPTELATVIGQALSEGQWEALTGPQPTMAATDGTAATRRDRRIAQRALGHALRVLNAHCDLTAAAPVQAGNEAA